MARMNPGKRTEGAASLKVSYSQAVPPNLRGKVREVSGVLVDQASRKHGAATELMRKTMLEADLNGLALLVVVAPFDDEPMSETALRHWYGRMGFNEIQKSPCVMVRPAKN